MTTDLPFILHILGISSVGFAVIKLRQFLQDPKNANIRSLFTIQAIGVSGLYLLMASVAATYLKH